MADLGYRSIEVVITNDTRGNLTVHAPSVLSSAGAWIQGETPNNCDPLNQYNGMKFGVTTNDVNGDASARLELTGLGSFPIQIERLNHAAVASDLHRDAERRDPHSGDKIFFNSIQPVACSSYPSCQTSACRGTVPQLSGLT